MAKERSVRHIQKQTEDAGKSKRLYAEVKFRALMMIKSEAAVNYVTFMITS